MAERRVIVRDTDGAEYSVPASKADGRKVLGYEDGSPIERKTEGSGRGPAKAPSKADRLAEARSLGLTIGPEATKADIVADIADHQATVGTGDTGPAE